MTRSSESDVNFATRRLARSTNHQGVIMKAQPFQYSSLIELAERAERKAKAMEAANSAAARIAARPLFIALDGITDPQNLGAVIRSAAACSRRDATARITITPAMVIRAAGCRMRTAA